MKNIMVKMSIIMRAVKHLYDLRKMPKTMRQLGLVQFFSWFALFGMWVFYNRFYCDTYFWLPVSDKSSKMYTKRRIGRDVYISVYNGVSAAYALMLPSIAAKIGRKRTHTVNLIIGGIGLISFFFAPNKEILIFSMAWCWHSVGKHISYALCNSFQFYTSRQDGYLHGYLQFLYNHTTNYQWNFWKPLVKYVYNDQPIYALLMSGIFMLCSAVSVIYVYDPALLV
jgi:maltose/moltooligosaccharide transporter